MRQRSLIICLITTILSVACVFSTFAVGKNKLYFSSVDDELYYDSDLFEEALFMYHIDMTPGDVFKDELLIENGCSIPYDLYFQVIPVEQSQAAQELLDSISMRIYLDGNLVYDGRVTGLDYSGSGVDLQKAVFVGKYLPGKESNMVVNLEFSSEYEISQEVWSNINWKFWGVGKDKKPKPIHPSTGRNETSFIYVALFGLTAGMAIIFIGSKVKKKQKQ